MDDAGNSSHAPSWLVEIAIVTGHDLVGSAVADQRIVTSDAAINTVMDHECSESNVWIDVPCIDASSEQARRAGSRSHQGRAVVA
jgi:hypothetical protein